MASSDEGLNEEVAKFEKTVRRRNMREWYASAGVTLAFGVFGATASSASERLAGWVVALTAIFVGLFLAAFGRSRLESDVPPAQLHTLLKRELLRQAQLLRWAWLWYVAPLMGALLFYSWIRNSLVGLVIALLVGAAVSWINMRGAQDMYRQSVALGDIN